MHLAEDAFGDLIVLRRDDQYLSRLPVAGHHRVDRIAEHGDHYVAVDNGGNVLENEQRAADDNQIAQHQYLAVAYGLVLVDDQRDDVGSAGAAALSEADADAGSRQRAAQNGRQQFVVGQSEHVVGNGLLHDGHRDRDEADRVDRLGSELQADQQRGDTDQHGVQHQKGHAQRNPAVGSPCRIVDQQTDSVQPAAHDAGGDQDTGPCERVHQSADRDQPVLLENLQQVGF